MDSAEENYVRRLELKSRHVQVQQAQARQALERANIERQSSARKLNQSTQTFQATLWQLCKNRKHNTDSQIALIELREKLKLGRLQARALASLKSKDQNLQKLQKQALNAHTKIKIKGDKLSELISENRKITNAHKLAEHDASVTEQAALRAKVTLSDTSISGSQEATNPNTFQVAPGVSQEIKHHYEQSFSQSSQYNQEQQQNDSFQSFQQFEDRLENIQSWKKGSVTGLDLTYVSDSGEKALMNLQSVKDGQVSVNIIPLHKSLERKLQSIESRLNDTLSAAGLNFAELKIGRTTP